MAGITAQSGYVDNWQTGKTVIECNLHMLESEDCSDVSFLVGSEKHVVRAHRYVLVSRSCVFHAMLCGPLAEQGEITISDVESQVFREFLRFVYTDKVNITADNVTGLMYTSRKYAVDTLFSQCSAYLAESMSNENVCQILEQSHVYGELALEQKALKMLTSAGEEIVKSAGFLDLCSCCLKKFLKSEDLNMNEERVFEATLAWTREQCKRKNVPTDHKNIRKFLGDMIYEIRFISLSLEYMVKIVGPSHVLTAEERLNIIDKSVKPDVDISPFQSSPRRGTKPHVDHSSPGRDTKTYLVKRFTRNFAAMSGYSCNGTHAISFCASKDIQILGCQLYGPARSQESIYTLDIIFHNDEDKGTASPVMKTDMKLRGGNNFNDVMFPEPAPIKLGRTYTVSVTMSGEDINYGEWGKRSVAVDGVEFNFYDSTRSTNRYTSRKGGQIPSLKWRY